MIHQRLGELVINVMGGRIIFSGQGSPCRSIGNILGRGILLLL